MDSNLEEALAPLRKDVKDQGDLVRSLKEQNAPKVDLDSAIRLLKEKKKILELKEASLVPKDSFVDKTRLEDTLKRRFFYDLSFSIYGGVSGLFDYGPPGVALKNNILQVWKSHFVFEDDLLEIEASQLTLEPVLKASGHVERFADLMVKDTKSGDCYRLDHLIKSHLEKVASTKDCTNEKRQEIEKILAQLDGYSKDELGDVLRKFDMKAPATGNDLTEPVEFNLMFSTTIGPTGLLKSFLRPETAQGIFVNFKRLLEANSGKLPFGVAQIGKSFRNEIAPRGGLIRMREFTMGEIEYFVDPEDKKHPKYDSIKNMKMNLYSACNQMSGESFKNISLSEAVDGGIVANETLAYFLARIHLFMKRIGMDTDKIRFRQHMSNEMAHYATDCWDCECLTSFGWLECVGCADRSCYDLNQHAQATNTKLCAKRPLKAPKQVDFIECVPQKSVVGMKFKADSKVLIEALEKASEDELSRWKDDRNTELADSIMKLSLGDKTFDLTKDMVVITKKTKTVIVEDVVPNVIEPSFGIDRIMYSLLEHNYKFRPGKDPKDTLRTYFTFPAEVAPIKCSVLPLIKNDEFNPIIDRIVDELRSRGLRLKVENSGDKIGKRYARTDEIGIPYGITVDFDTLKDNTVTLRFCPTLEQVRVDLESIANLVRDLSNGTLLWTDVLGKYPAYNSQDEA